MKCNGVVGWMSVMLMVVGGASACGKKTTSGPSELCGDGVLTTSEGCDDTNLMAGDGCSELCAAEAGWRCAGAPSVCEPVCGDDLVIGGEACDGSELEGATCASLGLDSGDLACDGDCGFDVSGCTGSPECGNGYVDPGEFCDDGNAIPCDGCENNCQATPGCGDGVVQCDEECDQLDFESATCDSLGHDGGALACTVNCNIDESACVDCLPGLTYCAGAGTCVDLLSDNDHCGGCGGPCGAATVCIGGLCQPVAQPWSPVGQNPVGVGFGSALAHDLATDGAQLTVALVEDAGGGDRRVHVLDYSGAVAWNELAPSPAGDDWFDEAISLAYDGATPNVAFGGDSSGPWGAIRVMFYQAGAWQEVGAPGFPSACGMHMFIDLALDGPTPHLTSMGAGGCGIGVDYGWYDGTAWQTRPSVTGFPGQLTMNGQGNPAIVYNNEPLIGLADWDTVDSTTIHSVKRWDAGGNAWADVDGELDVNLETGWTEHIALALDAAAVLYTAWVESDGGAPATDDIYVKRHDATAGTWSLLGGGEINGAGSATLPSITIIGTTPWVAYVERANTDVDVILVRRFDETTSTWELIGTPLNQDIAENATAPVIVSMGGVPHVAFREEVAGPGSAWQLFVKRFP